jgi:hypothetical protein
MEIITVSEKARIQIQKLLEEQKLNIESLMFNYKQLEFEPIKIDNSSIGVLKFRPLSVFFLFLFNF